MFTKRFINIYFAGICLAFYSGGVLHKVGLTTIEETNIADILSLVRLGRVILCAIAIPCALLLIASATEKTKPRLAIPAGVMLGLLIILNAALASLEAFGTSPDLDAARDCALTGLFLALILYTVVRFYRNETKGGAGSTEEIQMDQV